ncbi:MAG: TIGR03617 family F420-dependent LLM class oxidoreductase [Hyphomonadaceae bacterium]|nr:TIGR03617 family F420-dependent LLM class oxidoreductase [Hyphomonadaceae bacterium]MBX3509901.1 TIGR03617 family F420-dependent LLM class oxidoreductase [Hyphomonadaceae bacterium]
MQLDALFRVTSPAEAPGLAARYEDYGISGLWTAEKDHDPHLLLALAATGAKRATLGTAIALAFNRSPMSLAYTAWDLQTQSEGRYVLGLGTQVRAHIERRFSAQWERPAERLREVILSLRAIWSSWANRTPLNFEGEFYKFNLMTPEFVPPPLPQGPPPIYVGAVNPRVTKLAGELCDGFHVHPFHSAAFLKQTVIPNLEAGAHAAGRTLENFTLCSSAFCIVGDSSEELAEVRESVRRQLAFYASTKAYRAVLEAHGWEDVGDRLALMAREKKWREMPGLITDAMVDEFAVSGTTSEIAGLLKQKYDGLLQRVAINYGPDAGIARHDERLRAIAAAFRC